MAMTPPEGSACMSRPRSAMRSSASSIERMPATHAAANSPTLWPITASGTTPHERHSSVSAYSRANNAGWLYAVWSMGEGVPSFGYSTASRSIRDFSRAAQRWIASRKTSDVS